MARPRTVSLSPDEMIELGKEMVEWVKLNDPLHLSAWYSLEKSILESEWKQYVEKEEFRGYYEQAMRLIGQKYLDKESRVRNGVAERWLRVYFKDLKESEDSDVDAEYQRKLKLMTDELKAKQELSNQSPEELKEQINSLLDLISSTQSSRKMERSNNNPDTKS